MSDNVFPVIAQNDTKSVLDAELELIARDIVESLSYSGAMVAAYERGDALPVRAIYTDPSIASIDKIREWEKQIQKFSPKKYKDRISITDPAKARVYLHQEEYKNNLSVKAAMKGAWEVSNDLFDLFVPIVPDINVVRQIVKVIQVALRIKQVVAVPFFIDGEYVGNLFAASNKDFSPEDLRVLSAFAHRAASSIRSERRRLQGESNQKLILDMQRDISSEDKILKRIVQGAVEDLGYTGAMVATYELGGALPARATYLDPSIVAMDQIEKWEKQIQSIVPGSKISITDPTIARVYLNQREFENNLSVKAAKEKIPIVSKELFDLFTPIVPDNFIVRQGVKVIQAALKIKQVIAVPFFIDKEYVGNLFAVTQSEKFNNWEIELLQIFGQNAAVGLRNARLYRQSEERRKATEILGVMAFSAVTSVHAFNNHIGAIRGSFDLLGKFGHINQTEQAKSLADIVTRRLDDVSQLLKQLDKPAEIKSNIPVNVNACIERAIEKLVKKDGPSWLNLSWLNKSLSENLPNVLTSQEMLTEAFRILIKNSFEALSEGQPQKKQDPEIWVRSRLNPDRKLVDIEVQDNGTGIKPENLEHLFELKQTTKKEMGGLGFGLFWTRNYVEGLNGKITVKTEWQKGTTFIVSIPSFSKEELFVNS
jgi:signal transduction histidine kinase